MHGSHQPKTVWPRQHPGKEKANNRRQTQLVAQQKHRNGHGKNHDDIAE
jgi:hypothetical protein